eukprot:g16824.t1
MTLSKGKASDGGAILANHSSVSFAGNLSFISNSAVYRGGAIHTYNSTVSWDGVGAKFISNSAGGNGGAISVHNSTVSFGCDDTAFSINSAGDSGGAIYAFSSRLSWDGDDTEFISNWAGFDGGAVFVFESTVLWKGDGTEFSLNSAGAHGGAIYAESGRPSSGDEDAISVYDAIVSWDGDGTEIVNNTAGGDGGAIYVQFSIVSWDGDGNELSNNSAGGDGGAIYASSSTASGDGDTTFFFNSAARDGGAIYSTDSMVTWGVDTKFLSNSAARDGGAVSAPGSSVSLDENTTFTSNAAGGNGGALAVTYFFPYLGHFSSSLSFGSMAFIDNRAESDGGAIYLYNCVADIDFNNVTFQSNWATGGGGALAALSAGGEFTRVSLKFCTFKSNKASGAGGAVDFLVGQLEILSCKFEHNFADCAVCETDFSSSPGHSCTRCSSSRRQGLMAATVIATLVAIVAMVIIFKYMLSTEVEEGSVGCIRRKLLRAVPVQALKIVTVVWQILTQFADAANVTYPGVYQDFLNAIDVINFDLGSALAAGCLWSGVDFHGRLLVSTLGPLIVVAFLGMTYLIAVRRNGGAAGDAEAVEQIRQKHQAALLLVTFFVYSSVSSTVFQTFACETLDDGTEYLREDYRIHCTDARHKAFEVYAGIMVAVYPVGIPLLYAVLLFQRRDVLADAGADKTVAQSIAGLWEPYRPEWFYYEVVECGRRIMLTGVVVFIFPNDAAQIAITMLISFFFFAVFEMLSPYTSESDMWLSRGGHVLVFLSMFDLLMLKVDVSGERNQSQAAFAGVFVAGHVLMFVAIVVEVVGVCVASRKGNFVEGGGGAPERPRVGSNDVTVVEFKEAEG